VSWWPKALENRLLYKEYMKTLYIVRHAKSSWESPDLDDLNRPVIENGIRKTKKVIDFLLNENVGVDLIISSHALRAIETARLLADGLGYQKSDILINTNIYNSDEEHMLNEVYALPNDKDNIMLIGHNPTFTQFANFFLAKKIDFLPTSAVISISFDTERWEKIESCIKKVNFVAFPKRIK